MSATSDDGFVNPDLKEVKRSRRCQLLLKQCVQGIGLGTKRTGGVDTEDHRLRIVDASTLDCLRTKRHLNVVLALNVLHHLFKTRDTYRKLAEAPNNLHRDEFFLQTHRPDEEQMRTAYKNPEADEFVDFILMNADLREAQLLGSTFDRRKIYRLS